MINILAKITEYFVDGILLNVGFQSVSKKPDGSVCGFVEAVDNVDSTNRKRFWFDLDLGNNIREFKLL